MQDCAEVYTVILYYKSVIVLGLSKCLYGILCNYVAYKEHQNAEEQ